MNYQVGHGSDTGHGIYHFSPWSQTERLKLYNFFVTTKAIMEV